jgi:hypothetical protein
MFVNVTAMSLMFKSRATTSSRSIRVRHQSDRARLSTVCRAFAIADAPEAGRCALLPHAANPNV